MKYPGRQLELQRGVPELLDELKTLRKGYGVETTNLAARLGPALRSVCEVGESDAHATTRHKVVTSLTAAIDSLPVNQRQLSRLALGLDNPGSERYQKRVERLAHRLGFDERAIQRRIDDALTLAAGLANADGASAAARRAARRVGQRSTPALRQRTPDHVAAV